MRPRIGWIVGVLLLCALCASAQDFRKVTWGMSVDDVTSAESDLEFAQQDSASGTVLSARVYVMARTGTLNYVFENGKLVIGQYRFDDEDDMGVFKEILGVLKKKYGAASSSGATYSRWKTARTYVSLSFKDDVCRVDYADPSWVAAATDKQKAQYDSLF
ncbi:MAG TPA: hypothetical protein VMM82_14435 [Spirochaetia bacterium]|nr:hypothetical protein [Spirochaetia bacterium]